MASQEDHRNAKIRSLIMRQHDLATRRQTNSDQLKTRLNIKRSQIARQAEYEAAQFRSAASARPLETWLAKQPPRFNDTPRMP